MNTTNYQQTGFTLLEVIVAMAIVGMTLGTLFGLLAGSKRLAYKAVNEIEHTVFLRAAINTTQLAAIYTTQPQEKPDYPAAPERYANNLTIKTNELLEVPDRQTQKIQFGLESYTLILEEGKNVQMPSVRWKKLDAAR